MRQMVIIKFKDAVAEDCCYSAWMLLCDYLEEKGVLDGLVEVLPRMSRVWIDVETTAEGQKCVGFATLAQVWDVANFHCEDDRTRVRLIKRISTVLEESAGEKTSSLVHVDPAVGDKWIPLLESLGAKPAERWIVPVGADLPEGGQNVLRSERPTEKPEQHPIEFDPK